MGSAASIGARARWSDRVVAVPRAMLRRRMRALVGPMARGLLKYVVLRDPSIRSHHFGAEQMADLARSGRAHV